MKEESRMRLGAINALAHGLTVVVPRASVFAASSCRHYYKWCPTPERSESLFVVARLVLSSFFRLP